MKRPQDNNSLKRQRWLGLTSFSCLPGTTISQLSVILHSHSVLTKAFPSLCVIILGLGRNDISPSSSTRNPAQLAASGTKGPGLQRLLLFATAIEQETHKTYLKVFELLFYISIQSSELRPGIFTQMNVHNTEMQEVSVSGWNRFRCG